nr:MAG TPA: hypothetical protein [Caudoviricetes sp.]
MMLHTLRMNCINYQPSNAEAPQNLLVIRQNVGYAEFANL